MRTAIALMITLASLLLATACAFDNSEAHEAPPTAPQPMICDTDADCASADRNCQHGLCVDGPKGAEVRLSAAILPPPDRTALSPLTINQQDFPLDERIHVALRRTRSVNGKVTQPGREKLGKVQIFFSRQSDIPGRRYTNSTSTDAQGNFAIQLPEGDYTVTLRTEWEDFPEHNTTLRVKDNTEGAMVYFDLPREDHYMRWTGRLVRLDQKNDTHPVQDVILWAQDTQSSARSSMATTDENGVFTFYLAKSVTAFQMQSRARNVTDNGETYAIPAATFPTFYVEYPDDVSTQDIPGYELNLGKLQPSKRIAGIVVDPYDEPVAGARVFAQTRVLENNDLDFDGGPTRATIEHSEITDESGAFSFLFPPYSGVSLTAFDNQYGPRLTDARDVLNLSNPDINDDSSIVLKLRAPTEVSFDVRDAQEQPINYFEVNFELIDSDRLSARQYDARSEEFGGMFSIREEMIRQVELPKALWNITIVPRADYTLPRFWFTQALDEKTSTVQAFLPHGVVAAFQVDDDQGQPVRGATVELWAEELISNKRSTPLLLGTGQSDASGRANVLIPYLSQPARKTGVVK